MKQPTYISLSFHSNKMDFDSAEKRRQTNTQFILSVGYITSAAVFYIETSSQWALALLVSSALILPFSFWHYYLVPKYFKHYRLITKVLWLSLTTAVLFLFGNSSCFSKRFNFILLSIAP